MAVCYDNQDHPEYQNLTNVFYFITEMCSDYRGALPLQFYIDSLPEEHPAKILLAATKVAAMRTSDDEYIRELKSIVERNGNLWSAEAERYFIQNAPEI